ncbi:siroheme synthase CysG [Pantoea sp. Aalb]|uniref:siroheme synthase CysG n=1 Tax=Pantoea sp. Aalb TaxID=2576762 RepID=UPI00132AAEFC|nr:siroheme synthase CysG [Pantoea sp. Aalb]MXP67759.1 uroporphyrinogen-III C-methyltransferase [Pantoea sp. Aalb]
MNYLPIFVDIKNRVVLVVGGGVIAAHKIKLLLRAGAKVQVVAHDLNDELQALLDINAIELIASNFNPEMLDNVFLVISATNDNQLNTQVFKAAHLCHKLVNVVDDKLKCNFIFPSIIDRSPLIIAISSSGTAPVLSRILREKIESFLPSNIGQIAKVANKLRDKVKHFYHKISDRRRFWENVFNGLFTRPMVIDDIDETCRTLESLLLEKYKNNQGEIILVGAGPGDSGLLTLRGLQVIQVADVVLYDYLVSSEILDLVRREAKLICVGKRAGLHSISQKETNNLIIKLAQQGKRVVRLKGGDPFIFGRGAEELQAAQKASIPFQVVPGITAAIGATAYAGIPLTHRDYAQSVIYITGHYCINNKRTHWELLTRSHQTLVIYMGTIKAAEIATRLIEYGRNPITTVAVIGKGTCKDQKVLIGTLNELEKLTATIPKPALLVIGEVVELHKKLAWF